jgi:hypothetical protein
MRSERYNGTGRRIVNLSRMHRGEQMPQSRLTEAAVRELRVLRGEGWSWGRLGARYGVSRWTVRCAALGETWAHVGEVS